FPKKVWAAESRLMKFPVNYNGRPMVAPTKIIYRIYVKTRRISKIRLFFIYIQKNFIYQMFS
ncbi:MAG: hypothetical protein ACI4JM_10045, partial [Oscillospiraceae bacterium]